MFGFKRKEEEQANLALIPHKESIFIKFVNLFKRDKDDEEKLDVNYSQTGSTRYSDIRQGKDERSGKEVFSVDVSTNGMDTFLFKNIREDRLLKDPTSGMTKLIRADLSQEEESVEGETYKICFEIPVNVYLEEFIYSDGPYVLIKSGNIDMDKLNQEEVTAVGNLKLSITPEMKMTFTVADATKSAQQIAKERYTPALQKVLNIRTKKVEKTDKSEVKKQDEPKENIYEERERRKKDNRVVAKDDSIYLTDPENGDIIKLEEVTPVKNVVHNVNNSTSTIYIATYRTKNKVGDVEQLDYKRKIAFELSKEDMNDLIYNRNENLTMYFRRMMSSNNIERYNAEEGIAKNHVGYLRKTEKEKYEILLASEVSKNFLASLEKEKETAKSGIGPSTDDDASRD